MKNQGKDFIKKMIKPAFEKEDNIMLFFLQIKALYYSKSKKLFYHSKDLEEAKIPLQFPLVGIIKVTDKNEKALAKFNYKLILKKNWESIKNKNNWDSIIKGVNITNIKIEEDLT